ncbi:diguanylate cyclase [Desulfomicrobium sp. ZS1]|uniref:diguanylate cyclase domain-containing protein n=1 Tax=Desulfomicrobium sp. ZS1 TaxID=2952228 RepID=UPI0020B2B845|nr:diguanylate cyclase [Desulfomicrobium sp. ZS1]UTF51840.1 diguanylate cyclase [Desulfomicrobium sp. ZS1]
MKKRICFFSTKSICVVVLKSILLGIFTVLLFCTSATGYALDLSPEEEDYLRVLKPLSVCVDPDWEPFERITRDGKYIGIAADLLRLVGERAGVTFLITPTRDWEESVALSKAGRCDILAFLNMTPQREEWLIFTEPYFIDTNVIVTRAEHDYVANLAAISNETMALPKGTSIEERVRRDYPNVHLVLVDSEAEAFRLVENRKADMTLRSLTMAAHTIKKEGWFNLKIAGQITAYANAMRIGMTKDKPVLRNILNKAVATLTPQEVNEIVNRHVSISITSSIDYSLLFKTLAAFLIVVGMGLAWMTVLRRKNRTLATLGEQLRRDMEARVEIEAALRQSEERYRLLVETAQEGIVVAQDGYLAYANPAVSDITGYSTEELKEMPFTHYVFPEDRELLLDNHKRRLEGKETDQRYQLRVLRKNGEVAWVEMSGTLIEWGRQPASLNFLVNISKRKAFEEKIKYMAQHDPLTGLPNRTLFFDRLNQALALAQRERRRLAMMFIDLNNFKPVNDTLGHDVGDLLLQAVGRRIAASLRASDTVGRIGGDEFVVLLPNVERLEDVQHVAEKIGQDLSQPFDLDGRQVNISASIGSSVFPDHGEDSNTLFRHADQNMYLNKSRFNEKKQHRKW